MSLKLTYFPFPGRAQPSRACLNIAGIKFEDVLVPFPEFMANKGDAALYPLGQMPVLTLPSGKVITQSNAISRYAAKLAKLYPTDPEEALLVDEIVETLNDAGNAPQNADNEVKKKLREEWAETKLKKIFAFLTSKMAADGKSFIVGGKLSLADISLYGSIMMLRSGMMDYIPITYDSAWPAVAGYVAFLEADPKFGPEAAAFKPPQKA